MTASAVSIQNKTPRNQLFLLWGGCFLFYFLIMLCAPYTYDDYEFALVPYNSLSELVHFCLTYGNGRLLGNMGAIFLNQNPVFGAIAKAFVMATTVLLFPAILGITSARSFLLSFLLVTAIDPELFAQVVTWTSGFQNYVPPVFLMLVILYIMQHYPKGGNQSVRKIFFCLCIFILGFSAQLYIEHSSIINIFVSMLLVLKAWKTKDHNGLIPAFVLLAATVCGMVFMFWIPAYYMASANNHTSGYRSLYISNIPTFIFNCARNALRLTNHYFGMCGLPLCGGALLTVYLTRSSRKETCNSILYGMSLIPLIYMLVCSTLTIESWYGETALIHHAFAMLMVLSALFSWVLASFGLKDKLLRDRILVLLGLGVFSLLPLLIVTPIRIRVFYHSQSFIVMAFILCLSQWMSSWNRKHLKMFHKGLLITSAIVVLTLGSVFVSINAMNKARHTYTVQQIEAGNDTVDFFRIPYSHVHDSTDHGMGDFYYRNTPKDIVFNIIDFDQWMNDYYDSVR